MKTHYETMQCVKHSDDTVFDILVVDCVEKD